MNNYIRYTFYSNDWEDINGDVTEIEMNFFVFPEDLHLIKTECSKAYDNWFQECVDSILCLDGDDPCDLAQIPICDYIISWLEKCNIRFVCI